MSTFVVNAGRSAVQTRQEVTRRKRVYKLDRKGCAMKGFFGDIFDFNRDGKLDSFEKAAEFAFLSSMTETEADHDEFCQAGIDPEDLEYMSADERREILEDAGLDPEDYDF